MNRYSVSVLAALLLIAPALAADDLPRLEPKARRLCALANRRIDESSGLACGRRNPDAFWSHNDSGNPPRLHAFNARGDDLGTYRVMGARNYDWEDMASCTLDGKHLLLVGDTGGNVVDRESLTVYVVPEPPAARKLAGREHKVLGTQAIHFRFKDGMHDCEALAVDATSRTLYLVTKTTLGTTRVYELTWPTKADDTVHVARPLAALPAIMVTAMDISTDGRRAVVVTYGDAIEFLRRPGESWPAAFKRPHHILGLPRRIQGEAACYSRDAKALYLTSEKLPTPLWELPLDPRSAK